MTFSVIQSYATLAGLVLDIVGVILLARELVDAALGGTRRLLKTQRDLNLKHATQGRAAVGAAAVARASGANWFAMMWHEIGIALRRADAQLYSEQVRKTRASVGLSERLMVGADGFVDTDAVHVHSAEMDEHYRDLGEAGTLNPKISRLAFALIIAGFVLQFLGALPIGSAA